MKLYNPGIGVLVVLVVIIDSCDAYIDNSNFDRQRDTYRAWMQEDQSIWLEDQASFLRQYEDTNEEAWSNVITSAEKYVPEISQLRTDFDFQEKKLDLSIDQLSIYFESLGRAIASDQEYNKWTGSLRKIRENRSKLEELLIELYIADQKLLLNPDDEITKENLKRAQRHILESYGSNGTFKKELEKGFNF